MNHRHTHEDHDHHSHEGAGHVHPVVNNLWVAFFLNFIFTIIEFIGGIYTNSIAIISDAIHDLGDCLTIGSALVLEKQSYKGRSKTFTYGRRRFSVLAALLTSLILIVGSGIIIYKAVERFRDPQQVNASGVIGLAVVGLLFNGAAVWRLKRSQSDSLNQRAVMLHLMEDVLGWLAVIIGGVIMYFTSWFWIDPLLSILIAIYVLYNAFRNIQETLRILLQGVPSHLDQSGILLALQQLTEVKEVHDLHFWTLDGEKNVATVHLVIPGDTDLHAQYQIRKSALEIFKHFGIFHATIQIEIPGENCDLQNC